MESLFFKNKKIMIIGGTGSLGNVLSSKLLEYGCEIWIMSRDENKQWEMKIKFPELNFILCDIRQHDLLKNSLIQHKVDIIILAAALKHIDICETHIDQCILTNLIGCKNVVNICSNMHIIDTLLFVSTDKACMPINVYGICKSLMEKIVINASKTVKHTKFMCVRYGNVLNSRGSLIPKFIDQCNNESVKSLTVTDAKMTRFFMTLNDSVKLIFNCLMNGNSGDIFIPIIPAFKIIDVANTFAKQYNKEILIVGIRGGEKLHECLINEFEFCYTTKQQLNNQFLYIINYTNKYNKCSGFSYTSENTNNINTLIETLNPYVKLKCDNCHNKNIVIFGSDGMLGKYVSEMLKIYKPILLSRNEYDIENDSLSKLDNIMPKNSIIINCAGLIKQRKNININSMYIVNGVFPNLLSIYCNKNDHKLIHITTDCVYDGKKGNYIETDAISPIDDYGISKAIGERNNSTIIRTSIIGEELKNKLSFLEWLKKNTNGKVNGFCNHFWNGLTCLELARIIKLMIDRGIYWEGVRHIFTNGRYSKYDLITIINSIYNLNLEIEKTTDSNEIDRTINTIHDNGFKINNLNDQIIQLRNNMY